MASWDDIVKQLWILPLGLVGVAAVAWMGCLKHGVLRRGPRRDIGLGPFDLLVAFGLLIMGMSAAALVASRMITYTEDGQPAFESPAQFAGVTILVQLISSLPPVVFVCWRALTAREGWRRLGLRPAHPVSDAAAGAAATVLALPVVLSVVLIGAAIRYQLGYPIDEVGHPMLRSLLESDSTLATLGLALSAIVIAPVVEEILYRGLLQTGLLGAMPGRRWTVVFIAAGVFALQHWSLQPQAIAGLFVLGIYLGWLYERTGSLLAPITLHVGFNAFNFLTVLLLAE